MKRLASAFILGFAAFASAAPSPLTAAVTQAAQQTPENAQRFLNSLRGRYRSASHTTLGTLHWSPLGTLLSGTPSPDVCISWWDAREPVMNNRFTAGVDWRHAGEVRYAEGSTTVTVTAHGLPSEFVFESPSLAARAAFAMEFLRLHCDPRADTGF